MLDLAQEVNADKTKYMVMSWDKSARLSHSIKIDNSFFEKVEQFKYLGTALTNQNSFQEEIKSRLKSGNACYRHSVQNILSSSLPFRYLDITLLASRFKWPQSPFLYDILFARHLNFSTCFTENVNISGTKQDQVMN
jgi:hypothetical protein